MLDLSIHEEVNDFNQQMVEAQMELVVNQEYANCLLEMQMELEV